MQLHHEWPKSKPLTELQLRGGIWWGTRFSASSSVAATSSSLPGEQSFLGGQWISASRCRSSRMWLLSDSCLGAVGGGRSDLSGLALNYRLGRSWTGGLCMSALKGSLERRFGDLKTGCWGRWRWSLCRRQRWERGGYFVHFAGLRCRQRWFQGRRISFSSGWWGYWDSVSHSSMFDFQF